MTQTINWVPQTDPNIGSVLIYRADNTSADQLGSRTIINTIDAFDGNGSAVTTFTDATGTSINIYRIQFFDGVGSSTLSNAVGENVSEDLATFEDVARIARIQGTDIGSDIVFFAIQDASNEVFDVAGDPIKSSYLFIDQKTGFEGQTYNFNGHFGPVYQIREVLTGRLGNDLQILSNADYEIDFTQGNIKFTDEFIGSTNDRGRDLVINWVPRTYNILVKNMAALNVVEGELIFTGADTESPNVERIRRAVDSAKEAIKPRGLFSIKTPSILLPYDVIGQSIRRKYLFFDTTP